MHNFNKLYLIDLNVTAALSSGFDLKEPLFFTPLATPPHPQAGGRGLI